jgi:hypothetical protein
MRRFSAIPFIVIVVAIGSITRFLGFGKVSSPAPAVYLRVYDVRDLVKSAIFMPQLLGNRWKLLLVVLKH